MVSPQTLTHRFLQFRSRYSQHQHRLLSSLLTPSPQPTPIPTPNPNLLSPADRFRGVFLHKPPGRAALHRALSAAGAAISPEVLSDVVNRGNLGGAATVAFFEWAITKLPPCLQTCNVVVRALGRRKFFDFLDHALAIMRKNGVFPDLTTVEIMMDSLVVARQVNRALQLRHNLGEIGAHCNQKDVFNVLLKCLCRRSHVGVASSLLQSERGQFDLDNAAYNEVIGGWARFGKIDKVDGFWTMMLEEGLVPDSVSYCHLIEALGRAGQLEDAIRVFEKMEEEGCSPSTAAYSAVICNFVSAGDLEKCIQFYKDMVAKNCPPDIETYSKMIRAFLKVRRVADALEMFDEMLGRGAQPNAGMITSFIEPLCSFGPPHAAMVIYKKSRESGCTISLKAYKLLLERLARFGKSGMVLKLWEDMQENGYSSDKEIYQFLVNGLCNVGKVDAAVSVVEESLRKGFCLGRVVYGKLNNKLLEMNKVETAYNLFKKVKEARAVANSRSYCRANGWHF